MIQISAAITPIGECQCPSWAHIMVATEHLYGPVRCHLGDLRTRSGFHARVIQISITPIKEYEVRTDWEHQDRLIVR